MFYINISQEEFSKLGSAVRERKFKLTTDKTLYTEKYEEIIVVFIKSFKFLDSLHLTYKFKEEEISKKIDSFLKNFRKIYNEAIVLKDKLDSTESNYTKRLVSKELKEFFRKNNELMENLISEVFPIGKVAETYDPDSSVGTY